MAKISKITLYWKYNFVMYNDSDITTDYFNSYSLGQKETCNWLKADGAEKVIIRVCNDDDTIPHLRRVKQFCKIAGYGYTDKSHEQYYTMQKVTKWVIEYELHKTHPSVFVVFWPTGTDEDFFKSAPMDARNKDIFIEDLMENGIRRIRVKEF